MTDTKVNKKTSKKTSPSKAVTKTSKKSEKVEKKNTGMAILAYIFFLIPMLTESKDDPFVKFHIKQGIVLFAMLVGTMFIGWIPVIGWIIALFAPLFIFILFIIGVINASGGKEKQLPLVGQFADKFEL